MQLCFDHIERMVLRLSRSIAMALVAVALVPYFKPPLLHQPIMLISYIGPCPKPKSHCDLVSSSLHCLGISIALAYMPLHEALHRWHARADDTICSVSSCPMSALQRYTMLSVIRSRPSPLYWAARSSVTQQKRLQPRLGCRCPRTQGQKCNRAKGSRSRRDNKESHRRSSNTPEKGAEPQAFLP